MSDIETASPVRPARASTEIDRAQQAAIVAALNVRQLSAAHGLCAVIATRVVEDLADVLLHARLGSRVDAVEHLKAIADACERVDAVMVALAEGARRAPTVTP